jgi:two-component system KDP operon response regulator KdpE
MTRLCEAATRAVHTGGCAIVERSAGWSVVASSGGLTHLPREEAALAAQAVAAADTVTYPSDVPSRLRISRPAERKVTFVPLPGPLGEDQGGVLRISGQIRLPPGVDQDRLLTAFANEARVVLHRARLQEEALRTRSLQEADRFKSALLSSVSHDLRSPLMAISTSVESLADRSVEWSDEDREAFLATIQSQASRLTSTVNNLLEMSRIEGGAITPHIEPIEASQVVEETALATEERTGGRRVDTCAGRLWFRGDWGLILQSMTNLVRTRRSTRLWPPHPHQCVPGGLRGTPLRGRRGPGIPRKICPTSSRSSIGVRVRPGRKAPASGSPSSRRWSSSAAGTSRSSHRPGHPLHAGVSGHARAAMSGARVLVVDDDPAILRGVRRYLESSDFRVDTRAVAAGLLPAIAELRPDVLLLDLVLPDGDATTLSSEIRAAGETLPIIVLSAVGDERRKVAALEAGADDYLTKPFGMPELLARLRVAIRRSAGLAREPVLRTGPLSLDLAGRQLAIEGTPVHLTPKEFELMRLLLTYPGRVLTQRHLLAEIWGAQYVDDSHILRTLVHQLRRKVAALSPGAAAMIANDPGVGYRLNPWIPDSSLTPRQLGADTAQTVAGLPRHCGPDQRVSARGERGMVTHVSYDEIHCGDAATCLNAIRAFLERGWAVTQLRGRSAGPFVVVFRKDDAERSAPRGV